MLPTTRTPSTPFRVLSILVVLFGLGSVYRVPETTSTTTEPAAGFISIAPGSSTRRDLKAGAKDALVIPMEAGKLLRFSIDKGDLLLSTTLYGPTGAKLFEHVSHDFEVVDISFPTDAAGTYRIELQSLEKTNTTKPYELKVRPLKPLTPLDRKSTEGRHALANAEWSRADWTEASLREAIKHYDDALSIWMSVRDFAAAADATLKAGDVYFLFGEFKEAAKQYENAEALAIKADDWLIQAKALSHSGRLQSYIGKNALAHKQLTRALELFKQREASFDAYGANAYGEALSNLGVVLYSRGDYVSASELFEKSLKIFENNREGQARVHLFKSYIAGGTGESEKAVAHIAKALELYRAINNKSGEGLALNTLGLALTSKGDTTSAIKLHHEALEIFRYIGDRHSQAVVHNALGVASQRLSDYVLAIQNYGEALRLFETIGAVDGVSISAFKIAQVNRKQGHLDRALADLDRCLRLSRGMENRRIEAYALNEVASIYIEQRRPELATKQYQRIEEFYRSIGDRRGQAMSMSTHGDLLLQAGERQKALEVHRRALGLSREVDDKGVLLSALYNVSQANLELGLPETALPLIEESLEIIEHLRANVSSPDLRASYLSGVRQHYDLCVSILMHLERLQPGKGFALRAFQVNEKGRARALIDLISESHLDLRKDAPEEVLKRERELRASIRAMARYVWELELEGDSVDRVEVTNRLANLRSQYQQIQAQFRELNPKLQKLERFVPVELKDVQKELQGSDTLLLQYALDAKRSYLWAVTSNSFQSYELPEKKVIEDAAREFYDAITARQAAIDEKYEQKVEAADKHCWEVGTRLSEMLLGPVSAQLNSKKLLLVTEGALQFIPFEALPVPLAGAAQNGQVLLETNEISALPSISTLIAIRALPSRNVSPEKTVAVIADPVFNVNDDRVRQGIAVASAASDSGLPSSVERRIDRGMRDVSASRLIYSAAEADAISAVAPRGSTMIAKDFDATRETAMSSHVGQFQIVHFATHGFLDDQRPELSALVLGMVDRNGVKTNGLMPLHDIYSLDLSAELTVLSACQTALGKDIKGEGAVGLTHGFISAGSKSVVASLWKVDDRATAVLMRDFYESLLKEGMPTGKALRAAKLKMLRDKRWNPPYYWAGFVLQGEYTNRIAVGNSWSWRPLVLTFAVILMAVVLIVVLRIRTRRFTQAPRI